MIYKTLKTNRRANTQRGGAQRRGTATVELAVCLPLLFILSMGAMEGASLIFLRQALIQSAYETVKESVRTNGSQAEGLVRGEQTLSFRNIDSPSITFSPTNVDSLDPGTPVPLPFQPLVIQIVCFHLVHLKIRLLRSARPCLRNNFQLAVFSKR